MLDQLVSNNQKTLKKVESSWLITHEEHGLRADQYLVRRIGRISRERAARIILKAELLVDNQVIKCSTRLRKGQRLSLLRYAPDFETDINDFIIEIIYQNNDFIILNKPPGISIHPSANCLYKTITYWLRVNFPGQRFNPCHRIDKETSGLLIVAKNKSAESLLKKLFMSSQIKKTYVAIVNNKFSRRCDIQIPLALQKDRGLVAIRMIEDLMGKKAHTKVRPIFYNKHRDRSLVICRPITGRQHQIRAHLSLINHPIIGDKLYAYGELFFDELSRGCADLTKLESPRHALHAYSLAFNFAGKYYRFKAKIPDDFLGMII